MEDLIGKADVHRVWAQNPDCVRKGIVRYAPTKSLWFLGMSVGALVGCPLTFTWGGLGVFIVATVTVLLLGHSLGNHRKLVHDSYRCPKWLFDLIDTEYSLRTVREGTELRVRMTYRVSTAFNWYARPLARLFVGNFEEAALAFYAHRAERGGGDRPTVNRPNSRGPPPCRRQVRK